MFRRYRIPMIMSATIILILLAFQVMAWMNPAGPGGGMYEIDVLGDHVKIYWNGVDVTDQLSTERLPGTDINYFPVGSFSTKHIENNPPQDCFYVGGAATPIDTANCSTADFRAEAGQRAFLLWYSDYGPSTYAQNGKRIASLSFTGLKDEDFIRLTPVGLVFYLSEPGTQLLYCEITDNRGVTTQSGARFIVS